MPRDEFDEIDDYDELDETLIEDDEDEGIDDDAEYEDDEPEVIEAPVVRRPNRKQRRSATRIPSNAPRPQDRRPKRSARQAEAEDTDFLLTLWGTELRIDRRALVNSWDFQEGAVNKNPLQMVKGILGDKQFGWFTMKARAENLTPFEAAGQVMELFAEEDGFGNLGNS